MNLQMKMFVALWLLMITRSVGAILAARHCLRIRDGSKTKAAYETFTAFGVGLGMWAVSDFLIIWNGVANVSPQIATNYKFSYLMVAMGLESFQTLGVWLIALVLMNGGVPGSFRKLAFGLLSKLGLMGALPRYIPTQLDRVEKHVEAGVASVLRAEKANAEVANNLKESQKRADEIIAGQEECEPGSAADAASISPPVKE